MVLDAPQLEGGRFEIARKVDADLEPFTLNVITRTLDQTRLLQAQWRTGATVKLIVRVFVTRRLKGDPDHVVVTNLNGGPEIVVRPRTLDGERWMGFRLITPKRQELEPAPVEHAGKSHPWCLLVEQILPTPM